MRRILVLAALLAAAACHASDSPTGPARGELLLRAGTSFGHCIGYCATEMVVTDEEVVLTRTSRDPALEPRTFRLEPTSAEYRALADAIDPAVWRGLDEVYGCPDCADGGAEWIELGVDGRTRRVTFEYGDPPAPIAELADAVRALRDRFEPMVSAG